MTAQAATATATTELTTSGKGFSRAEKRVDKLRAAELRQAGATYQEIARTQGVSPQAIHKAIKHLLPTEHTETYKQHRADILATTQLKILSAVEASGVKVDGARDLKDAITAFGILVDKERLERGQATSRIEIDLSARLRSALSRSGGRQAIEAEVIETKSTTDRVTGLLPNDPPNADGE